jgi:UTP--glucose-1-phosphate uridylyltransferase
MTGHVVRKAIFPAAGLGTRFLPVTKAQPKEMLPLVDKPTIQYGVEEAIASGIEQVIMVTGGGKRAIVDHFDRLSSSSITSASAGATTCGILPASIA